MFYIKFIVFDKFLNWLIKIDNEIKKVKKIIWKILKKEKIIGCRNYSNNNLSKLQPINSPNAPSLTLSSS